MLERGRRKAARELRLEVSELKLEIAKLQTVLAEVRAGARGSVIDLPTATMRRAN
jgi:hypothetical protein